MNALDITSEIGTYLVKLARKAAVSWIVTGERLENPSDLPDLVKKEMGAFVTVKKVINSQKQLRGCIGYPLSIGPLYQEIIDLAKSATLEDPRFPPVREEELSDLIFEVTVLTTPKEINYETNEELLKQINIGKDGLIVSYKGRRGLLLPQVPIEQKWDAEEFLANTCRKAYLPKHIWKEEKIKVEKFSGVVFGEMAPNGPVNELDLS